MLTNEKIAAIHANAVAHGFWEPGSEPTFGEYCALIHEEISEAFSAWRNGEPYEYVKDGKPEGVWVELADVVIRCADWLETCEYKFVEPDIELDSRYYRFGEFVSLLHTAAPHLWNKGNDKSIRRLICIVVVLVYRYAEHNGIALDAIIERKHAYNVTRPWRHGKRM